MLVGDDSLSQLTGRPTNPQSSRLILAFFSAGDSAAGRAARRALKSEARSTLYYERAKRDLPPSRYSDLRLSDEQLLIAETAAATVQSVVEEIRQEQPVAVFVISKALTNVTNLGSTDDGSDLNWAREAARGTGPVASSKVSFVQSRLAALESDFENATADLSASVALGHAPGPAASWILENGYLVLNEVEEIQRDLDVSTPEHSAGANYAQVHALARGLLKHNEHEVTEEGMLRALREFQSVRFLTTAELWSFAQMLRLALLEEISALASDAASVQQHREAAYLWADRLIVSARLGEESQRAVLKFMDQETYARSGAFLAPLAELLQGEEEALPAFQIAVGQGGRPLTEFVRAENTQEALRADAAARAFGSLRALARVDVRTIFEQVSVVDEELRRDVSGIYAASDFETRDRCRQAVERISKWSGASERVLAQMAVALAAEQDERWKNQVPYFLVGEGVAALERKAGAHLPLRVRFVRAVRRHSVSLYLFSVFALTGSLDAVALQLAHGAGVRNPYLLLILGALAVFPLSELALQIVHAFIIAVFPPSRLPRMDFESGIPTRTQIYPTLFSPTSWTLRSAISQATRLWWKRLQRASRSSMSAIPAEGSFSFTARASGHNPSNAGSGANANAAKLKN